MHGASNYPLHKEQSDVDVPLADGTKDEVYLDLLAGHLDRLIRDTCPDIVMYQCGVDILSSDKLGRLGVSMQGCAERDRMVFEACSTRDIPVVCAMGGGYSPDVNTVVQAHVNTFRAAQDAWT
jgi:acetoin utilization deacetylase AcuC-like enzyme